MNLLSIYMENTIFSYHFRAIDPNIVLTHSNIVFTCYFFSFIFYLFLHIQKCTFQAFSLNTLLQYHFCVISSLDISLFFSFALTSCLYFSIHSVMNLHLMLQKKEKKNVYYSFFCTINFVHNISSFCTAAVSCIV